MSDQAVRYAPDYYRVIYSGSVDGCVHLAVVRHGNRPVEATIAVDDCVPLTADQLDALADAARAAATALRDA